MTASTDFWQRVMATARELDSFNYYQLFGVDRAASTEQISDAFYRFARAIHPDKHALEPDPERQRALVKVYARLHEGYRVLSNQQHRAEYDTKLDGGEKRHAAAAAQIEEKVLHKADPATAQGRQALERGVAYFEAGDLPKARAQLSLAKQLEPNSKAIDKALAEIMKTDRRAFPRYELDQRVEVQCASWEQPEVVYIKDVSRSGMFLKSNSPPEETSRFDLKLCLPRTGSLFVEVEVMHRIGPKAAARHKFMAGFGVRFIDLSEDKWGKIEELLPHYREASRAGQAEGPPMSTRTGKQAVLKKQPDTGHARVAVKIPKALLRESGRHKTAEPREIRMRSAGTGENPSVRGTTPGTGPASPAPGARAPTAPPTRAPTAPPVRAPTAPPVRERARSEADPGATDTPVADAPLSAEYLFGDDE